MSRAAGAETANDYRANSQHRVRMCAAAFADVTAGLARCGGGWPVGCVGLTAPMRRSGRVLSVRDDTTRARRKPREAVRYYDEAVRIGRPPMEEMDGASGPARDYAKQLARLQMRAMQQDAASRQLATSSPGVVPSVEPDDEHRKAPRVASFGPSLAKAAWARLTRWSRCWPGTYCRRQLFFLHRTRPGLPRTWALEGALLAAMASRWRTSLQYYRAALAGNGKDAIFADALHRYVFIRGGAAMCR